MVEETLTCQSVCPFKAYKKVNDQYVCVKKLDIPY